MRDDVAIVGAGPAGARAAFVLASGGARVTIFDWSHPREKPCGGGVTGRALSLVADAIDPADCAASTIRSARFTDTPARRAAVVALEDAGAEPALVVADRATFDAALLAAAVRAGATLDRSRVTDVALGRGGVELSTTGGSRTAAFVVGADGATSLVRRRAAAPFRRDQLSIATGFFAHGVTSDEIAIEFTDDPAGYIWSFPRPTHLAIGICAQADAGITAAALRGRAARAVLVADPLAQRRGFRGGGAVGTAMGAGRRCRGSRRSDHARRDLLRGCVRPMGRRRAPRGQPAALCRSRARTRAAGADACGAAQGRLLPGRVHRPPDAGPAAERRDPRSDGRPHRRTPELSHVEMAAASHVRVAPRDQHRAARGGRTPEVPGKNQRLK